MKKLLLGLALFGASFAQALEFTDVYDFRMSAQVPRVYDNTQSLGYRKYQTQTIKGEMCITYNTEGEYQRPRVWFKWLTNATHKINGKYIGYSCMVDEEGYMGPIPRINLIGDNKKDTFTTPSVIFYLDAEPDYSIGEDDEDNSLLITIAGRGSTAQTTEYAYLPSTSVSSSKVTTKLVKKAKRKYRIIKSLNGYFAGTLGCGCRAYGHVSPTRVNGAYGATDHVDDVASVMGTWSATYSAKKSERAYVPDVDGGTGWSESTCADYPFDDGWMQNVVGEAEDGKVVYFNPVTNRKVSTPAMFGDLLPSQYEWTFSHDKNYPSECEFYQAQTTSGTLYGNPSRVRTLDLGDRCYPVLADAYDDDADPLFKEKCKFGSLFVVRYNSNYYLVVDGVKMKMDYKTKDDFLPKNGAFYFYTLDECGIQVRWYTAKKVLVAKPM